MAHSSDFSLLPDPPSALAYGDVALRLADVVPPDVSRGFLPYYHFRILTAVGIDAGHINLRVGDAERVRYVGHVGFMVDPAHRGHGYARQACLALAPCVRRFMASALLTCDPDNAASRQTIERLGARFLDEVAIPPDESPNLKGATAKRRYLWTP
ncbi:MAG: GNAT family N-acetyltransferase [Candidatus Hydrogenedentes bacterium]|nr:GNAT family N-acetyltransferase [Candidatus Hydrogenedentota bacterium]